MECLLMSDGIDSNGIYVDILWSNEIKINVRFMSHHTEIKKHVDTSINGINRTESLKISNIFRH